MPVFGQPVSGIYTQKMTGGKSMLRELCYPFDAAEIMQKRRKLLRTLKEQGSSMKLRIAVIGGSTTSHIVKMLELFLRNRGIEPEFYESEYA